MSSKPLDPKTGNNRIASMRPVWSTTYHKTPYMLSRVPRMRWTGWLSRLCWWILHKIGGLRPWCEPIHTLTYTAITQKKVSEAIQQTIFEVLDNHEKPESYAIIMGSSDFFDFCRDQDRAGVGFSIMSLEYRRSTPEEGFGGRRRDLRQPYRPDEHAYRTEVFQIPIHVVPWVKGWAMVPKVVIQSEPSDMPKGWDDRL